MKIPVFPLAALLLCPIASWAADQPFDIKPGLWDISNAIQMSGTPAIPNLDQMTPEQRARVEAAMKKMSGAQNTFTSKSCVTRQGIEQAIARASSSRPDSCAPKIVSISASRVVLHIDCDTDGGKRKSNGDITLERKDSEHFTGTGATKTIVNGRAMDMKMTFNGAFVSSDCGSVKPNGQ